MRQACGAGWTANNAAPRARGPRVSTGSLARGMCGDGLALWRFGFRAATAVGALAADATDARVMLGAEIALG